MKTALKKHLEDLASFDGLGYDEPKENTLQEVAKQLYIEVVKHDKRRKTQAAKFTEALQGLPSYIAIPFYNGDIENLMFALGEERSEEIVNKFWNTCGEILSEEFNK